MKKKILVISVLFSILIFFGIVKLFFSDFCANIKIFDAQRDLNFHHLKDCISKENLDHNVKKPLNNTPTLYEFARKVKKNITMDPLDPLKIY